MKKVTKNSLLAVLVSVGVIAVLPSTYAASVLNKSCSADLKKAGCVVKTDAEVHECLEQHEAHGKKNDGFTHACYEAHEAYEKKMGKEEKGEAEHHDESSEQKK